LEKVELVKEFTYQSVLLTVNVRVVRDNGQRPVFLKEYRVAASPTGGFESIDKVLKRAEYHVAETVAWDRSFSGALNLDPH
jgi:hypothetical protein